VEPLIALGRRVDELGELRPHPSRQRGGGHCARLLQNDRLNERRIVVFDVTDARAHRPADHIVGRVGGEQRFQPVFLLKGANFP
jgi:hypothetical protein